MLAACSKICTTFVTAVGGSETTAIGDSSCEIINFPSNCLVFWVDIFKVSPRASQVVEAFLLSPKYAHGTQVDALPYYLICFKKLD